MRITIAGRAVTWNELGTPEERKGPKATVIGPDAFGLWLPETVLLVDHDRDRCIASTRLGSLLLQTDDGGLNFRADVPGEFFDQVRDLHCVSVGYRYDDRVASKRWRGGLVVTEIKRALLREISLVRKGAWPSSKLTDFHMHPDAEPCSYFKRYDKPSVALRPRLRLESSKVEYSLGGPLWVERR